MPSAVSDAPREIHMSRSLRKALRTACEAHLTLSTAHLSPDSFARLGRGEAPQGVLLVATYEYGWIVYRGIDRDNEAVADPVLASTFAHAHALGAVYVKFDADGHEVAALPWFEHT